MNIITTQNLIIREFTIDDYPQYYQNNNDEQIKKYMPNHSPNDENDARKEIEGFLSDYKNRKLEWHYAVVKDGLLIGHVGIGECEVSGINDAYELCCGINKDYRGYGYAAEATKAFAQWCKSEFNLNKVYASTDKENIASNKVLLKAGFILTDIKYKELNVYIFE